MENGNELHYIASGTAHLKINALTDPEQLAWNRQQFTEMQRPGVCDFGVLYNAFTESRFGENYSRNYRDVLCDIHADSGGLQMVTIGKLADAKQKAKIYANQATNSTIAMSFDEIPVVRSADIAKAGVAGGKWFSRELVREKARLSGQNLVEQLKHFADAKSTSKPMLIAQGNDMASYNEWVDVVQQQIPQELKAGIGGIAMASSCLGGGDLENCLAAYIFAQLPLDFECRQLHLLGIGSFVRLLPTLVFMRNGLYKDLVVSYDSTSLTSQISYGMVYTQHASGAYGYIDVPQKYDARIYEPMYERIAGYNTGLKDARDLHRYYVTLNGRKKLEDAGVPDHYNLHLRAIMSLFRASYDTFVDQVESYCGQKDKSLYCPPALKTPIKHLYSVKTDSDFAAWEREFSRHLTSKRVDGSVPATLEDIFE